MAHKWNPAQQNALDVRGRDTLVCAAAGSGKTAVLCQRILDRITDKEHPLELSRLLIVTFTNAAAAEMRARLQKGIAEALAKNPSKHLRRQAMMLHRANICTIDKYCINFVKSHFHLLGVSPDVNVAEDSAISEIKRRIMQKTIDRFYRDEPDFAATSDLFVTDRDEKSFPDTLIKLHENLACFASGTDAILEVAQELEQAADKGLFDSRWGGILRDHFTEKITLYREQCLDVMERYSAVLDKKGAAVGKELISDLQYAERLLDALEKKNARAFFDAVSDNHKFPNRTLPHDSFAECFVKYAREEFKKDFKSTESLRIRFDPEDLSAQYKALAQHCRMLHAVIGAYEAELMAEKKKRNLLEFSDMERMTLSLLEDERSEPTPLALQLQEEYDEIFIDEYQDVNEIQNRIFNRLSRGNRFLVGDVKQSIYGFRYADPTIFSSLRASFADHGDSSADTCRIFMQNNYRCDRSIIRFANIVCDYVFPHCTGMQYLPEDALNWSKEDLGLNIPAELHLIKADEDFYPNAASAEAAFLADRIAELLESGRSPRDIAILCRSLKMTAVGALIDELTARGIPLAVSGLSAFFDEPEIVLTRAILSAVDNPTRDIPLAAILRSPLLGFSDKELICLAERDCETLWEKLKQLSEEGNEKATAALRTLEAYRLLAAEEDPDALLFSLYESPDFRAAIRAENARCRAEAKERLDYLYGLSLECKDLRTFLARLDRMESEGLRDRKDRGQNEDKVRIMTVHGAKGLEFRVCCLFGCGKYFSSGAPEPSDFDPILGPSFSLKDSLGISNLATAQETACRIASSKTDLNEEMRVLYVALTRAKEHLIVTGTPKTAKIETFTDRCRFYAAFNHPTVLEDNPSYLAWILIALYRAGEKDCCAIYENNELTFGLPYHAEQVEHRLRQIAKEEAEKEKGNEAEQAPASTLPSPTDLTVYDEATAAALCEKLAERQGFRYKHSIACRIPAKLSVSTLREDFLEQEDGAALLRTDQAITLKTPRFVDGGKSERSAARRGSATHAVMQFCDFAFAEANGAEKELQRQQAQGFIGKADAELADRGAIDRFFESDLYREIKHATAIYRERRFMITLPASSFTDDPEAKGEELLVQGVIDCFFKDQQGRIWLVDYKTDRFAKEASEEEVEKELIERHGKQMRYYKQALHRLCGQGVYRTVIYSFHLNRAVILPDEI